MHGVLVVLVLMLSLVGCSTSDRPEGDADADGGAGDDASGGRDHAFGEACKRDADCESGLVCDPELEAGFLAEGLPGGVEDVPSNLFPGGMCTPWPAAPLGVQGADPCDPLLSSEDNGCGPDGVCVELLLSGTSIGACRPRCDPSDRSDACGGRFGYSCDFDLEACVEGCQSDEECRLRIEDPDGDGLAQLVYDDQSDAVCSTQTFRCELAERREVDTGEPCERLDDCASDGICIGELQTLAGLPFPGGFCSRAGCDVEGRECSGDDAVCTRVRSFVPGLAGGEVCMTRCTVGAEPEQDRVGASGHGEGCRDGYRCHYNGGGEAGDGICVGGNYNDIEQSNVGAACDRDEECYSPFGLGRCLSLAVAGLGAPRGNCAIIDCSAPGLPDDLCGEGNPCIALREDLAICAKGCKDASECAAGYACADDDADPATAPICYPVCFEDGECREGESCELDRNLGAGLCIGD